MKAKTKHPLLMGILNITPDSFSDGGKFSSLNKAVLRGIQMAEEGADIVDIGGESTRPGSKPIQAEEEIKRVVPVIKALRKKIKIPISVDTYKSEVAAAALDEGADIINDISALRMDEKTGILAAKRKVKIILMHMQGTPADMQKNPKYKNVIAEIVLFFKQRLKKAKELGIAENKIIIDPGIGFGKTLEHNLEIIKRLEEFKILGRPVMIGPSRKSFIGKILGLGVSERLEGTAAVAAISIFNGADIIRVHDVKEIKRVIETAWKIYSI